MRALFVAILLLVGCEAASPLSQTTEGNGYTVAFLFERDGCRVYRFEDYGRSHYFVNCGVAGSTSSVRTQTYPCGKSTCSREIREEVPSQFAPKATP